MRYAPVLDDQNRAPAGRFDVPLTVEHQHGSRSAPVVRVVVEASSDGKAWRRVPVRRTPHGWIATVGQPAGGFVSLRTRAKDASGNEVDQTIHRAYAVR